MIGATKLKTPVDLIREDRTTTSDVGSEAAAMPVIPESQATEKPAELAGDGRPDSPAPSPAPSPAKKPKVPDAEDKAAAFDKIAVLTEEEEEAAKKVDKLKRQLKAAKETQAAKQDELRKVIRETAHPEDHPIFQKATEADQAKAKNGNVEFTPADDAWRDVSLREALPTLSKSLLDKLEQANLHTMGELANWTAADGGRHRITDIPGVGPGAAEKIEEATTAFWSSRKADLAKSDPGVAVDEAFDLVPINSLLGASGDWTAMLKKAKVVKVGDLIERAKREGRSIFDTLRTIGFEQIPADEVVKILDQRRETIKVELQPAKGA